MQLRLSQLPLRRRLALAALASGALALFADVRAGGSVRLHERELLATLAREDDHVAPGELAGWIVAGRADYRLLDLRDEAAFDAYHIPTAEHAPLGALRAAELPRNEKLVLYSDGGIHAAQAWMLLHARGHRNAYTLLGGLEGWKEDVLFPLAPADQSPVAQARFERAQALARFFGGTPRRSGPEASALPEPSALPQVAPPALAAASAAAPPRKKKKEGC
jgi:rhodanese-related sulfurtransferase